eukprot:tig00000881_g5220.t1
MLRSLLPARRIGASAALTSTRGLTTAAKHGFIVQAFGPDRVGIVSELSKAVVDAGGNVEESRMARLAGCFSTIMLVTLPTHAEKKVKENLSHVKDMTTSLHAAAAAAGASGPSALRKFRQLQLTGADNPGILYAVTKKLTDLGVNIEKLDTATEEAPFTGSTLFRMSALLGLPPTLNDPKLKDEMASLESKLGVDIEVAKLPAGSTATSDLTV